MTHRDFAVDEKNAQNIRMTQLEPALAEDEEEDEEEEEEVNGENEGEAEVEGEENEEEEGEKKESGSESESEGKTPIKTGRSRQYSSQNKTSFIWASILEMQSCGIHLPLLKNSIKSHSFLFFLVQSL